MRTSQSKWDSSDEVVKSKSCLDRIFNQQRNTYIKSSFKQSTPVSQKLKLSKNYSHQKSFSSRSLKSLKLKSSRTKNQINIEQIRRKFQQAQNFKNQNKKVQISISPYLKANTLQTSLASLKVYEQRQNLQTMFSSRKYSGIKSNKQTFQDSNISLRITKQKTKIQQSPENDRQMKTYTSQKDSKNLSSTRMNTAFVSKNSFFKEDIPINEQQSDEDVSILFQKSRGQEQKIIDSQKLSLKSKAQNFELLSQINKTLVSPERIKLVSARQVQTIQSIRTQQSIIVSEAQRHQGRDSQVQSNIFHRILALKKH